MKNIFDTYIYICTHLLMLLLRLPLLPHPQWRWPSATSTLLGGRPSTASPLLWNPLCVHGGGKPMENNKYEYIYIYKLIFVDLAYFNRVFPLVCLWCYSARSISLADENTKHEKIFNASEHFQQDYFQTIRKPWVGGNKP